MIIKKTYFIRYWRNGDWHTVQDHYSKDVTFTSFASASAIAHQLVWSPKYPKAIRDYQIGDSDGWFQNP